MKKGRVLFKAIRTSSLFAAANTTVENGVTLTLKMDQQSDQQRYCYKPSLRWNPLVEDYFIKAYGPDHFSRISEALTRPSCYSCIRVNALKTTSDAVIGKLLEILQETENSDICSEATLGISENVHPLKKSLQSPLVVKCQIPSLEEYVVFVRGSGPHTIQYVYKEDRPPKEVIVSRKCAEAVLRGAQVYVPGVLACSAHVEKGDVVAVSVAVEQPGPDGGWGTGLTRGTVLHGLETDPHYFERNGLYIGHGTAMLSRAGIFRVLQGVAVDMSSRVFMLASFNDVLEGEIFLQNLPSIIAAHALDPQQGEKILDMCAAPGGKTTAIAILMKDNGEVVACDRSHNKVLDIQKLASEMGLNCIKTYKLDALKSVSRKRESIRDSKEMTTRCCSGDVLDLSIQNPDSLKSEMRKMSSVAIEDLDGNPICGENVGGGEQNEKGTYSSKAEIRKNIRRMKNGPGRSHSAGARVDISQGFSPNSFDRVLLDAPCSALGLRPRLFAGEETLESLRNHSKYQRKMFDQAVQLVRPGGVIVYSTCTLNPGENEALVRYALDTYKFLSLASQHPKVGGPGLVGRFESSDGYIEEWLRPGEEDLVQRFDPSSSLDTIGFFVAKFSVGHKDLFVEKL